MKPPEKLAIWRQLGEWVERRRAEEEEEGGVTDTRPDDAASADVDSQE